MVSGIWDKVYSNDSSFFGEEPSNFALICYEDFIKYHGEQGAKEAGKWRLEGKEYIVKDGDIVHIRSSI